MSRCAAATSWRSGAKPPECLPMLDRLYTDLADGTLRLVKLAAPHREALRAACAADADIWAIYSSSFDPEHLDQRFDTLIGGKFRMTYALIDADRLVGMTRTEEHTSELQ